MRIPRKQLTLIVGLGCSALFLWLAARDVNGSELLAILLQTNLLWLIPFIAALSGFCWLKSVRWAHLLTPAKTTSARELIGPVIIGYMGTGLMPLQLGEVARAYLAATKLGIRLVPVLASLLVERVLDIFALLVIVGIIGLAGNDLAVHFRAVGLTFVLIAIITLAVLWLYASRTESFLNLARRLASILPAAWQQRLIDQLEAGAAGVQVLRRPASYLQLALLSLLQWSCMCACTWISVAAIGHQLTVVAALAVLATTIVSMTLPSGPGYIGTMQLAYVVALAPFGIGRSDALAASVFYLVALWVPLVAGGLFLLHRMGLAMNDLKQHSTADAG